MSKPIIDTSVLIDFLRGKAPAVGYLGNTPAAGKHCTHLIVAAELLAGSRNKLEMNVIDSFLASFELVIPNESDGLAALSLYRNFHLSHNVDWPDCQIAATALRLGNEVVTLNVKHYSAFPGLKVVKPY